MTSGQSGLVKSAAQGSLPQRFLFLRETFGHSEDRYQRWRPPGVKISRIKPRGEHLGKESIMTSKRGKGRKKHGRGGKR